jgi:hypothetical protein
MSALVGDYRLCRWCNCSYLEMICSAEVRGISCCLYERQYLIVVWQSSSLSGSSVNLSEVCRHVDLVDMPNR